MRKVYSTGQVAKVCMLSIQTIIRACDEGLLIHFKVPGSKFRKIPRDCLVRFMKDNGIPFTYLDDPPVPSEDYQGASTNGSATP